MLLLIWTGCLHQPLSPPLLYQIGCCTLKKQSLIGYFCFVNCGRTWKGGFVNGITYPNTVCKIQGWSFFNLRFFSLWLLGERCFRSMYKTLNSIFAPQVCVFLQNSSFDKTPIACHEQFQGHVWKRDDLSLQCRISHSKPHPWLSSASFQSCVGDSIRNPWGHTAKKSSPLLTTI